MGIEGGCHVVSSSPGDSSSYKGSKSTKGYINNNYYFLVILLQKLFWSSWTTLKGSCFWGFDWFGPTHISTLYSTWRVGDISDDIMMTMMRIRWRVGGIPNDITNMAGSTVYYTDYHRVYITDASLYIIQTTIESI